MKNRNSYIFLIVLIGIYLISLFGYFNYLIIPNIKYKTKGIQDKINSNIIELIDNIDNNDSISDAIKKYQKSHSSSIYIEDENGKIIYNNTNKLDLKLNNYISRFININGTSYLIKLFESNNSILNMINYFIIFEIIIILIIFIYIKLKLLKPIDNICKSINNYKFGKKPEKNKSKSDLGMIQNEFVELVDTLEKEKDNQKFIISSISHDIKTPVTSILGYSDLLINSKLDNKIKEKYINIIYNKALLLKDLTDEFQNYLCENKDINKSSIKIIDLKKQIEDDYKIDLKNKGIKLNVKLTNLEEYINIDLNKIKRVFNNIISNSVRYINSNGIIEISGKFINNYYQFEILDNGIGTKEDLEQIFEPLFTTDKSRKISGLGLSICREIINKHGGVISAYNNKLGGLTIRFTINNNI